MIDRNVYNAVAKVPPSFSDTWVVESFPEVTKADIDNGFMMRYFARQANHHEGDVFELDKSTYDQLQTSKIWKTVAMEWRIVGRLDDVPGPQHINSPTRLYTGVRTANQLSLNKADKEMPGLKYRVINLVQFWVK